MIRTDALNSFVSSAATRRGRERLSLASIPSSAYSFIDFTKMNSPRLAAGVGLNEGSVDLYRGATSNSGREPGVIDRSGRLYFPTSGEARYEYVDGKCSGLRISAGTTNYLANTLTFGTSGQTWNWVQTNMTGAGTLNAIGPDGATSAVTLTATGANATILQNRGALASVWQRRFSVWLRRVSGSGDIQLTYNPAGGYTTVTLTSSWTRFTISAESGDVNSGIRIVTSGDVIEAAFPMVELTYNSAPSDETVGNASCASAAEQLSAFPVWKPSQGLTVICSVNMTTRGQDVPSYLTLAMDDGADTFVAGSFSRNPLDAFDDAGSWDANSAEWGSANPVDATRDRTDPIRTFGVSLKSGVALVSENGSGEQLVDNVEFPWNSNMYFTLVASHLSVRSLLFINSFSTQEYLDQFTRG